MAGRFGCKNLEWLEVRDGKQMLVWRFTDRSLLPIGTVEAVGKSWKGRVTDAIYYEDGSGNKFVTKEIGVAKDAEAAKDLVQNADVLNQAFNAMMCSVGLTVEEVEEIILWGGENGINDERN